MLFVPVKFDWFYFASKLFKKEADCICDDKVHIIVIKMRKII